MKKRSLFSCFAASAVIVGSIFSNLNAASFVASASDSGIRSSGELYQDGNYAVRVGEYFYPGGLAFVMPFLLPTLSAGEEFTSAHLRVQLFTKVGTLPNADLYGLNARSASTVLAGDYYAGAATDASATLIQSGFVTNSTPVRIDANTGFVETTIIADGALTAYLNTQYANGANAGKYVFLRISLGDAIPSGNVAYEFLSSEAGGTNEKPLFTYTVGASAIPEPSTSALLGGFFVAAAVALRRSKRAV